MTRQFFIKSATPHSRGAHHTHAADARISATLRVRRGLASETLELSIVKTAGVEANEGERDWRGRLWTSASSSCRLARAASSRPTSAPRTNGAVLRASAWHAQRFGRRNAQVSAARLPRSARVSSTCALPCLRRHPVPAPTCPCRLPFTHCLHSPRSGRPSPGRCRRCPWQLRRQNRSPQEALHSPSSCRGAHFSCRDAWTGGLPM